MLGQEEFQQNKIKQTIFFSYFSLSLSKNRRHQHLYLLFAINSLKKNNSNIHFENGKI